MHKVPTPNYILTKLNTLNFECFSQVIIDLTDKETADVPLIVRRPPIISDNSTRSVVATADQRVELRCFASGYPPPKIYWRRQDNAVLPTNTSVWEGNVLVFPRVRKEHRGTYYCVATNVVGQGARRNVDVEVKRGTTADREAATGDRKAARATTKQDRLRYFSAAIATSRLLYKYSVETTTTKALENRPCGERGPGKKPIIIRLSLQVEFKPTIKIPRKRLGQALQFDMDLECQIEAYPPPAIKWFRDNIPLTNNQHYQLSHFAFDDEYTNTILRVITIEKKQYANYTCQ